MEKKKELPCGECALRKKYDARPGSLMGRFWRWHIGFCPGWRQYMRSLDAEKRQALIDRYHLKIQW